MRALLQAYMPPWKEAPDDPLLNPSSTLGSFGFSLGVLIIGRRIAIILAMQTVIVILIRIKSKTTIRIRIIILTIVIIGFRV